MNAQRGVNIDFSLAAEPTRWEETLPEVCSESERWKEAMDDEIVSMTKFGVYKELIGLLPGIGISWDVAGFTNERSINLVKWFGIEPGLLLRDFVRKLTISTTQIKRSIR